MGFKCKQTGMTQRRGRTDAASGVTPATTITHQTQLGYEM